MSDIDRIHAFLATHGIDPGAKATILRVEWPDGRIGREVVPPPRTALQAAAALLGEDEAPLHPDSPLAWCAAWRVELDIAGVFRVWIPWRPTAEGAP